MEEPNKPEGRVHCTICACVHNVHGAFKMAVKCVRVWLAE